MELWILRITDLKPNSWGCQNFPQGSRIKTYNRPSQFGGALLEFFRPWAFTPLQLYVGSMHNKAATCTEKSNSNVKARHFEGIWLCSMSFVIEVLKRMGFGERWISWVCGLLSTSSTRIMTNGIPVKRSSTAKDYIMEIRCRPWYSSYAWNPSIVYSSIPHTEAY